MTLGQLARMSGRGALVLRKMEINEVGPHFVRAGDWSRSRTACDAEAASPLCAARLTAIRGHSPSREDVCVVNGRCKE